MDDATLHKTGPAPQEWRAVLAELETLRAACHGLQAVVAPWVQIATVLERMEAALSQEVARAVDARTPLEDERQRLQGEIAALRAQEKTLHMQVEALVRARFQLRQPGALSWRQALDALAKSEE